jgi:hypothetical protein
LESTAISSHSRDFDAKGKGTNTLRVKDTARRIVAPNGLSHRERPLLTESLDYMRRGPCVVVSIEAGHSPDAERKVRALARRVKSDIALRQRRAGMRRVYSVSVFEARTRDGSPKFGAHIVALMPTAPARDKLIQALNGSAYGKHVDARSVYDWPGLTTYLLKEATPQAWYGAHKGFRRVGGSIPLGELGGDRVIPSNDLKDTLLRTGRIEPYRRTYAKRLPKVVTQPVEPIRYRESLFDGVALPTLIVLPPPKAPPRKREKIPPPSLPMAYPPTIADLLAGLGETHAEAAALVAISRSQASNVIVGRFGVSRAVVQRVLELSRAA